MHVLIRTTHLRNRCFYVLNRCSYSQQTIKCMCVDSTNKKKHLYQHKLQINNALVPNHLYLRNLSFSAIRFNKEPLKPSSKVELSVQEIKKQQETKLDDLPAASPPKEVVKKSIKQKVIDELVHYYHGFRLLFIDVKISSKLMWRIMRGYSLTRREHRLLVRTVADMFRLLPFSVFIIVPFMEFLLPVFIKLFPNMLPSTFQTASEQQDKLKQGLKVKLEMAKFLQQTLDDMAVQHKDHKSTQAKEFSEWFQKVRTSGETVTNNEIMKYSKLFEDEITLDSLSRNQLVALCRVLEVQTLGTNNFLRFQLRMKLRSLAADDKMIQKEGVESLTFSELQAACRARGIRAFGVSDRRLRKQLAQWLDLSLNEKVPPSLLLLSRALMLPETIPTHDKLKATISSLPETVMAQTKVAIGEKEGKIDNKSKIAAMKEEERKVTEERLEAKGVTKEGAEKKQEVEDGLLIDKAPILLDHTKPMEEDEETFKVIKCDVPLDEKFAEEQLQTKDMKVIEQALSNLSEKDKSLAVDKEKIQGLKEEMADYQEDVHNLKKATAHEEVPVVQESVAAKRLFKRVNKLITKMDTVMDNLENKEKQLKKDIEEKSSDEKKEELLRIDDIMAAIRKIQHVPDESRALQIRNMLKKMDDDYDGHVKVEHVLKVIEMIGKENINLNAKQLDEVIDLLGKEEILEAEDKIEKALQKEKEQVAKPEEAKTIEIKKKPEEAEITEIKKKPEDDAELKAPKPSSESLEHAKSSKPSESGTKAAVIPSPTNIELPEKIATAPVKESPDLKNIEEKR